MTRWLVKLDGNALDLNVLSKRYTEPDCRVTKDDDRAYYLTSDEFAAMAESADVNAAASEKLLLINDLMRVRDQGYQPVSLVDVTRINDDGTRSIYVFFSARAVGSARVSVEATVLGSDGQPIPSPEPSIAQARLKIAQHDTKVKEALTYWRRCRAEDEEVCQYANKVYEVIREDMAGQGITGGKEEMITRGWATRDEIDDFQAWANSPTISGSKARHADTRRVKPGITALSDGEALAFIQRLFEHWLNWKTVPSGNGTP